MVKYRMTVSHHPDYKIGVSLDDTGLVSVKNVDTNTAIDGWSALTYKVFYDTDQETKVFLYSLDAPHQEGVVLTFTNGPKAREILAWLNRFPTYTSIDFTVEAE